MKQENTEKVRHFQVPQNSEQVKSFLGMTNYLFIFLNPFHITKQPIKNIQLSQAKIFSNKVLCHVL